MPHLLIATSGATALVIDRNVYVCGGGRSDIELAHIVQVYDLVKKIWTKLPPAPQRNCAAIARNKQLVLIGGREAPSNAITNIISTWTGQGWQQDLPAMPTKRSLPGVITYDIYVIVAGGKAEDQQTLLSSIDVLNTKTRQWFTPANLQLPQPLYNMQMTINDTHVCVASAGKTYAASLKSGTTSKNVWQLSVSTLKHVFTHEEMFPHVHEWVEIAEAPHYDSALLQGTAHPLAVGGCDMHKKVPTSNIDVYDPSSKKWSTVGQLQAPRFQCTVVGLNAHSFLVFGGYSDRENKDSLLKSVEVITVSS